MGLELGPGAPGGYPPGAISLRCCSFVSENISHADPQIEPIFSLPLHTISSKICSFPDCLEIQHAALGSNTYLRGTYEEAVADDFSLGHPVQGLASLEEKSGAD